MQIEIRVTKPHPIFNLRKFEVVKDGERAGDLFKGLDNRWNIVMLDPSHNRTFHAKDYHAAIRVASCFLTNQEDRIPHVARGVYVNDGTIIIPTLIKE